MVEEGGGGLVPGGGAEVGGDLVFQVGYLLRVFDEGADGLGGFGEVIGVEVGAEVLAGFGDGGAVGDGGGFAEAEAFGDGEAPAFVEGGEEGEEAVLVEVGEGCFAGAVDELDFAAEPVGVAELLQEVRGEPALFAGEDEGWDGGGGHGGEQVAPDAEHAGVVFAGFDGADHEDVGGGQDGDAGSEVLVPVAADGEHGGWGDGRAAFLQAGGEVVRGVVGDGEHEAGLRDHGVQPSGEVVHHAGGAPFGVEFGDEVVCEEGEAGAVGVQAGEEVRWVGAGPGGAEVYQPVAGGEGDWGAVWL